MPFNGIVAETKTDAHQEKSKINDAKIDSLIFEWNFQWLILSNTEAIDIRN